MAIVHHGYQLDHGNVPFIKHPGFYGNAVTFRRLNAFTVFQYLAEDRVHGEIHLGGHFHAVHLLVGIPGIEVVVAFPVVGAHVGNHIVFGAEDRAVGHLHGAALLGSLGPEGVQGAVAHEGAAEDAAGVAAHRCKQVGLLDSQCRGGDGAGTEALGIHAGGVQLGVLLQELEQDGLYAVMAHGLIVGRSLPFHFHHEETVLGRHLDEAGGLGLGTGIVLVSVKEHHDGDGARRGVRRKQFLRPVLVPEQPGFIGPGAAGIASGLFHHDAPYAQGLAVQVGFQLVGAVFSQSGALVVGVVIIVEAVVAAQDSRPGIGENLSEGGVCVPAYDYLEKGVIGLYRCLIGFGCPGGVLSGHIGGDGPGFPAGLAAYREDVGNLVTRPRGDDLVHERGTGAKAHDLEVSGAVMLVEKCFENAEVDFRVIRAAGGVYHERRAVVSVQKRLDPELFQQPGGSGGVQFLRGEDEKRGRKVVGASLGPGGTAVLDGDGRTGGGNNIGNRFPGGLRSGLQCERRYGDCKEKAFHSACVLSSQR